MQENDSLAPNNEISEKQLSESISKENESGSMWINNDGKEVEQVFGFSDNAELVNGRAAMVGFLLLIFTELVFGGDPVVHTLFGIGR